MSWMTWVLFVSLLWIYPVCNQLEIPYKTCKNGKYKPIEKIKDCLKVERKQNVIVPENFTGFIRAENYWDQSKGCIVFLKESTTGQTNLHRMWPQLVKHDGDSLLLISKRHIGRKFLLYVLNEAVCTHLNIADCSFDQTKNPTESCQVRCLDTELICKWTSYDENECSRLFPGLNIRYRYIINITATESNCFNCDNPEKKPEEKIKVNVTFSTDGETLDAAQAAGIMTQMEDLATSIDTNFAELTVAEEVTGVLVKVPNPEDIDEVSFAYSSPNESFSLIDDTDSLAQHSRSITVSKEAFQKAASLNVKVPFVALLRFTNLAMDEMNSTVLGNEVLAVEMGTTINNLTDKLRIHFRNIEYEGIPSCRSWNGNGSRPNWTDYGCLTIKNGSNIICECSHLTFFAILLTPLNETISSSDLKNLTIITQVGCGLSMVFLCIVLFTHFLLRRTKATVTTMILIHLVAAMCLLNFTFLINNFVAEMKNSVGCKIMAALMNYFMLATFTWFAVQAFHICLQLYVGGKVVIRRYLLKVSIISWGLPSVIVTVLLIMGKYGELIIPASDVEASVTMCWMTDNDAFRIVNIGYYAVVFLFTFTTFIIILSWLFCLKRVGTSTAVVDSSGRSILVVLGLCCLLGITWGFAFFAYGALRIPSYYIFTILNSFQGFFQFIYYYNTRHSGEAVHGTGVLQSSTNTSTIQTSLDSLTNPYIDPPTKEIKTHDD